MCFNSYILINLVKKSICFSRDVSVHISLVFFVDLHLLLAQEVVILRVVWETLSRVSEWMVHAFG